MFNKYGKVIIEGTTDNQEIFQLLLEASMSSYSADYNNLNMTRQKDKRLGTEYIIINNRLIDGNFVYMKTPLESIKESVSISNRIFCNRHSGCYCCGSVYGIYCCSQHDQADKKYD